MCRRAVGRPSGLGSPPIGMPPRRGPGRPGGSPFPGGTGFPGSPGFPGGPGLPGGTGFPPGIGGGPPRGGNIINFNPNIRVNLGQILNQMLGSVATMMQQFLSTMMEMVRRRNSGGTSPSGTPPFTAPPLAPGNVSSLDRAELDRRFPGMSTVARNQGFDLGTPQGQQWGGAVRFQNGAVRYNNGQGPSDGYTITLNGAPGQPAREFRVDRDGRLVGTAQISGPPHDQRFTGQFPRLNDVKRVLDIPDLGVPRETTEDGRRAYAFRNGIRVIQSPPEDSSYAYRIIVPGTGVNGQEETHYNVLPNGQVHVEQRPRPARPAV